METLNANQFCVQQTEQRIISEEIGSKMESLFTDEMTDFIIDSVRAAEYLWNPANPLYKLRHLKNDFWQKLTDDINIKYSPAVHVVQSKYIAIIIIDLNLIVWLSRSWRVQKMEQLEIVLQVYASEELITWLEKQIQNGIHIAMAQFQAISDQLCEGQHWCKWATVYVQIVMALQIETWVWFL